MPGMLMSDSTTTTSAAAPWRSLSSASAPLVAKTNSSRPCRTSRRNFWVNKNWTSVSSSTTSARIGAVESDIRGGSCSAAGRYPRQRPECLWSPTTRAFNHAPRTFPMPRPLPAVGRLHVVTDADLQRRHTHADLARLAALGGADTVQFRHKRGTTRDRWTALAPTAEACRAAGVALVVDDHADLALAVGAGLHVGQTDLPVDVARRLLGPTRRRRRDGVDGRRGRRGGGGRGELHRVRARLRDVVEGQPCTGTRSRRARGGVRGRPDPGRRHRRHHARARRGRPRRGRVGRRRPLGRRCADDVTAAAAAFAEEIAAVAAGARDRPRSSPVASPSGSPRGTRSRASRRLPPPRR